MAAALSERLLLTPREAGELIGRAPQTLAAWRCQGTGPAYVRQGTGRRARIGYQKRDLLEWLGANRVRPNPAGDL